MLMRSQWEWIRTECKLFGVVQTEEEVGKGLRCVVNDFDGLGVVSTELYDLWLDR